MRLHAAVLFLALPLSAPAQHNPAESNWMRVQSLAPGTTISVRSAGHRTRCKFVSATPDSLSCASGDKPAAVFQGSSVTLIQQDHRTKSTLIGIGIGAGGGAAIGAAVGRNGSFVPRGPAAAVLGVVGAVIGAVIGVAGNFAHTTIYRAP